MDSTTPPLVLALVSCLIGVLLGALMTGLFYRPGANRGPTQRIRHLLWCASLLLMEGLFIATAFGLYQDQATPVADQRAMGAGVALGAAVGGGWMARRSRTRAVAAARRKPPAVPPPAVPSSPLRTGWRRTHRTIDYAFGMVICGLALIGGTAAAPYVRSWLDQRVGTVLLVLLGVHVVTFLYGQLITSRGLAALNAAVRDDWHMRRRSQFILAAGPFVYVIPIGVTSPGMLTSLGLHLVTLWVGYRHTDLPPSGALRVAKHIARSGAHTPASKDCVRGEAITGFAIASTAATSSSTCSTSTTVETPIAGDRKGILRERRGCRLHG